MMLREVSGKRLCPRISPEGDSSPGPVALTEPVQDPAPLEPSGDVLSPTTQSWAGDRTFSFSRWRVSCPDYRFNSWAGVPQSFLLSR